ncbi:MAG: thioesterase [Epsilonproteobacteria bacterium]|nr:thioesterase [Campylobacterota bacterium]
MNLNTHLKIDTALNGKVIELQEGYAQVELTTIEVMRADEQGLVHGGFAFGAADYAAMSAVNDPNVVLAKSETKFLAPIKVGQSVIFKANITESNGAKHTVEVVGNVGDKKVFVGTFYTVVLGKHVFEL